MVLERESAGSMGNRVGDVKRTKANGHDTLHVRVGLSDKDRVFRVLARLLAHVRIAGKAHILTAPQLDFPYANRYQIASDGSFLDVPAESLPDPEKVAKEERRLRLAHRAELETLAEAFCKMPTEQTRMTFEFRLDNLEFTPVTEGITR
jgi:hypothetical protein